MSDDKLRPIGERLAVQPLDEGEREESGIIIPETAAGPHTGKPQQGIVKVVGTQVDNLEVGDHVLYAKQASFIATDVEVDGEDCILIKDEHVLAIIRD